MFPEILVHTIKSEILFNPIYPELFYNRFTPRGADAAHRLISKGNTVDGPKIEKLSCVQNIENNEILKVTKFQTSGTIGLIARLDFSRDGPHRPPRGK